MDRSIIYFLSNPQDHVQKTFATFQGYKEVKQVEKRTILKPVSQNFNGLNSGDRNDIC